MQKPTLDSVALRQFRRLQVIRAVFAILAIAFLATTFELGSPQWILFLAALAGIIVSGTLIRGSTHFIRICAFHLVIIGAGAGLIWMLALWFSSGGAASNDFFVYRQQEHLNLFLLCYLLLFLGNWYFWRFKHALTIEAALIGIVFVWLLSGHRNYYLDAPKQISELAWNSTWLQTYHLGPQHILLCLGVIFALALAGYLYLASARPLLRQQIDITSSGRPRLLLATVLPLVLIGFLGSYAYYVNKSYSKSISRTTNGVGQEGEAGKSPLGFHSAIGKTKQPAALVRLEGDYTENPWAPMLYIREGALSAFNGRELVIADASFDQDVPRVVPGKPYVSLESKPSEIRKKIPQSVYLLTEHQTMFGLDFPRSARLIKNPDTDRFNAAFQVLSFAPTVKLDSLVGESNVGNPNWDERTRTHYLRAPGSKSQPTDESLDMSAPQPDAFGEDQRYRVLALKITGELQDPLSKALKIVQYLSKASLYTRNPGHSVTQGGDPVAPYLFSDDKRGYCVHFAHAAAYLMRLVGIPSRIATGYLTDLNYAKDGHILLQLGDRHAWPEVYVEDVGWVVVDITPENAEGEEELVPDENLLEQLMSKLDPAQDLVEPLPPDSTLPEEENFLAQLSQYQIFLPLLSALLASVLLIKSYLRFGYYLAPSGPFAVRLGYISAVSSLADVGIYREQAETRDEFQRRVKASQNIDLSGITRLFERLAYDSSNSGTSKAEISDAMKSFSSSFDKKKTIFLRWLSILSPTSLTRWFRW